MPSSFTPDVVYLKLYIITDRESLEVMITSHYRHPITCKDFSFYSTTDIMSVKMYKSAMVT